ncbi:putative F-box domain-containing protein [Tanacetum coccineum]
MADYIPLKIQAEIMKRLPVISLIQFRSVSKQWKSVIDSPAFIADHCATSTTLIATSSSVKVTWNRVSVYSSNGIIKRAVIWNPSIKKTVTIVVPNVPDDDDDDDDDVDHLPYHTIVGFGVCPRTSDPKLVKITFNYIYQLEYATIPNQVEVFSLSSGLWKRPSSKLPRKSIWYVYPQVAINEFIYWLAYDMSSKDQQYCPLIMSFDLTSEEFTEVYLPQSLASCKTHVCISKLKESLVVLEKNHASNANVWIMQNGSFTHIFTINTPITSSIGDVAGFRNNGEPIIAEKKGLKESELIVYEPNSKQINSTGIAGPFCYFFASPYTQTLLLLDHKDSVDSETPIRIGKQGTWSGHFRRAGRTLKGVTSSSAATSSSTSCYGASKRYSQEEVNELVKKKSKIIGKRISASFNKKLVNLMTQLAEKGISLDTTPMIGEEDEDYEESDDEAMEDVDDGVEYEVEGMDDEDDQ